MAFNPFIGWTQVELEAELRKQQEVLASGSQITSVGASDVSVSQQPVLSTQQVIELLLKALYALDPDTYPLDSITRQDRTLYQHP